MKKMMRWFLLLAALFVGHLFCMEMEKGEVEILEKCSLKLPEKYREVTFHEPFVFHKSYIACMVSFDIQKMGKKRRKREVALFNFETNELEHLFGVDLHEESDVFLDFHPKEDLLLVGVYRELYGNPVQRFSIFKFSGKRVVKDFLFKDKKWCGDPIRWDLMNHDRFILSHFECIVFFNWRRRLFCGVEELSIGLGHKFEQKHPTLPILYFRNLATDQWIMYDMGKKKRIRDSQVCIGKRKLSRCQTWQEFYPVCPFHYTHPLMIRGGLGRFSYALYNSKTGEMVEMIDFNDGDTFKWHSVRPIFLLRSGDGSYVKIYTIKGFLDNVVRGLIHKFKNLALDD